MYKKLFIIFYLFISNIYADNILNILKKNPSNVLKIVDEIRTPSKSFIATLEVVDKNIEKQEEKVFVLNIGADKEKSFAIYQSPNTQKGQTILNVSQNIWIYTPNTTNPIKISPQQKLVGQASVADIVSLIYYNNYAVISYKKDNNNYLLNLQSINKSNAYAFIDLVVDSNGFPVKAIFYSLSNKVLKTMYFENIKILAGKERPLTMRIVNEIDKNLITIVSFLNIQEKEISSTHFNKEFIKKLAVMY